MVVHGGGTDAGVSFELENVLIEISDRNRRAKETENRGRVVSTTQRLLTYFFLIYVL